jgi:hypothetical protein
LITATTAAQLITAWSSDLFFWLPVNMFAILLLGLQAATAQTLNCPDGRTCTLIDDGPVEDCTVVDS